LLEEAVRRADAADNLDTALLARFQLGRAQANASLTDRAMVTFAWCLAQFDRYAPGRFPESTHVNILMGSLVIAQRLPKIAELPRERIDAVLADLRTRFERSALSQRDLWSVHQLVWMRLGDPRAVEALERWRSLPRDGSLLDCDTCEANALAEWAADRGDLEAAVAAAAPVFDGTAGRGPRVTCARLRDWLLAHGPLWLLALGRAGEARSVHAEGLRSVERDAATPDEIGAHLTFLAATGETDRALRLVERHLPPAEPLHQRDRHPLDVGVWLTVLALTRRGDRRVALRLPAWHHAHDPSGRYDVVALAERLSEPVLELTARYDARNGNPVASIRLQRQRDLLDLHPGHPARRG